MAQPQPQASSSQTQEYPVRLPKDRRKRYCMMNMGLGTDPNFVELQISGTAVRLERENNLKEFKTANDIDTMPKYGAGSEYGREQKEEARRKKYGIMRKKYNPDDQPWVMKVGSGKNVKKLKGAREGTVSENTSYYIFTQCSDGGFEAIPIDEWYTFTPVIKYNYLNAEEAEEEFERRDKQLNMFNIMLRRRYGGNHDDKDNDSDEEDNKKGGKGKKKAKPSREFMLVEGDEFGEMSDDDDRDEDEGDDDDKPKAKKGGKKNNVPKKKKNAKTNSDDEAVEESDEGDYDDREVDYMSDSSSSSESVTDDRDKNEKYEEKGVDEEEGLRKLIDSEEEDEEEENKNQDQDAETRDEAKPSKAGSDSESSSSSSDSDSDIEKNVKLPAALLMSGGKWESKGKEGRSSEAGGSKRKADSEASSSAKRAKIEGKGDRHSNAPSTSQTGAGASEGITEEAVRRYLTRKPMTIKDLLHKFKSKKLNIDTKEMTNTIVRLLKKIAPERKLINKKLYLSLKKPE